MRRLIIGSLVVLSALAGILSTPTAFAASKTATDDQPFWVTGSAGTITEVASINAYRLTGMTFYKLPVSYQSMTHIRYYLILLSNSRAT